MATIMAQRVIDREKLQVILDYIKNKIIKDEFNISNRIKNNEFRRRYRFKNKSCFKPILLDLTCDDFNKCDVEEQPDLYGEGAIYVFIKGCKLINFTGEEEHQKVYIKIKIPNIEGDLPIISFHVCEY